MCGDGVAVTWSAQVCCNAQTLRRGWVELTGQRGALPSKMAAISAQIPPAGLTVRLPFLSPHHSLYQWMAATVVPPLRPMLQVSAPAIPEGQEQDRKSTRLNSSHL